MTAVAEPAGEDVRLQVCRGGPLLVRGADHVVSEDGSQHAVQRPVVALCRCGVSARVPWCDGSHKMLPADRRPDAPADPQTSA